MTYCIYADADDWNLFLLHPPRTDVLMYSTYITSRPGKRVVGMQETPEPHSTAAGSGVGIPKIMHWNTLTKDATASGLDL